MTLQEVNADITVFERRIEDPETPQVAREQFVLALKAAIKKREELFALEKPDVSVRVPEKTTIPHIQSSGRFEISKPVEPFRIEATVQPDAKPPAADLASTVISTRDPEKKKVFTPGTFAGVGVDHEAAPSFVCDLSEIGKRKITFTWGDGCIECMLPGLTANRFTARLVNVARLSKTMPQESRQFRRCVVYYRALCCYYERELGVGDFRLRRKDVVGAFRMVQNAAKDDPIE